MKKKKILYLVVVMSILALVLSGFQTADVEKPIISEPEQDKVTIHIETWAWPPIIEYINGIIEEFEAENPNIEIEYNTLPAFGEGGYMDNVRSSYVTGDTPDIFFIQNTSTLEFVTRDLVRPIDDEALEALGADSLEDYVARYEPGVPDGWAHDGTYYGVPNEASVMVFYANKQYLVDGGYDPETVKLETWEDVVEVGKDLVQTDDDGNFTRVAFRMGALDSHNVIHDMHIFTKYFGGSILSPDGTQCTFNQPEAVEGVEYYLWLTNESGVSDPAFGTQEGGAHQLDWANGLSAFLFTNPAATMGYAGEGTPAYDNYIAIPMVYPEAAEKANVIWGWGWVVPTNSEHPAEAWKFIGALMADAERVLEESGFPPGNKGLGDSDVAMSIPAYQGYGASFEGASYQDTHANWNEIEQVVFSTVQGLVFQGGDVQEALDAACAEIEPLLE